MYRNEVLEVLNKNDYLKKKIFCRGFCLTNKSNIDVNEHPFYNIWKKIDLFNGNVFLYLHPQLNAFWKESEDGSIIGLIGHALNPFTGIYDENEILNYLDGAKESSVVFQNRFNELTGTFIVFYIDSNGLRFVADPVGLQSVFYCKFGEEYFVSSHSNLIGDLLQLEEDPFVTKLKTARHFRFFGNQLPGNISSFKSVYRLVPNHYVEIGTKINEVRFYYPHHLNRSLDEVCNQVYDIMKNTMRIISDKWEKPAISLTGGEDSKTTLACASEVENKYLFFSYDSQPNEAPDVLAARTISEKLSLNYISYDIPYEDMAFKNIEDYRKILLWNCGNVCPNNKNDLRKRIYLDDIPDYDVEVKSWASEVGRSRYTKRYNGRRNFGKKPTARKCTTFYKFLFFDRKILHGVDKIFEDYLSKFFESAKQNPIPWQDQFYWEWHWPSRDGVVLTCEQKYAHEITVPYNNRKLLELLLSVSEEDRINDTVYKKIRDKVNPNIDLACASIVDVNHTKNRARAEAFYYFVNNILP